MSPSSPSDPGPPGPQQEQWFQRGLLPHSSLHIFPPPVSLRKTRHLLHERVLRSEASLPPLHNENWHRLDFNYAGALFISTAAHFSGAQEKHFVLEVILSTSVVAIGHSSRRQQRIRIDSISWSTVRSKSSSRGSHHIQTHPGLEPLGWKCRF